MASHSFSYLYFLNDTPGGGYTLQFLSNTMFGAFNATGDDSLAPGDMVSVVGGRTSFLVEYVGVGPNGPVFVNGSGAPMLLTDTYLGGANSDSLDPNVFSASGATYALCFMAGTMIATPHGARAIETLAPGDLVRTHDGRDVSVKWLFVQTVATAFSRAAPIRVRQGALGLNLPVRDLLVSPDHALLLDGALVQAGALVNGATITVETGLPPRFSYYHLELEDHSLVLAEGCPAETFIDNAGRRAFDNWADYAAVHGEGPAISELDLPRIKSARQLPAALSARLSVAQAA